MSAQRRSVGPSRRDEERQVRVVPRVIFIGGAPMSGKSTVAAGLAAELGRPVISTDDLGAAVRAVVSRDVAPDLHAFAAPDHRRYYVETPVEVQLDHALSAHAALWPAIDAVARNHASWAAPAIIEGWALLPELVASRFARSAVWLSVPASVHAARALRNGAFLAGAPDPAELAARFAERSVAFDSYLRSAAREARLPFLELQGTESPAAVAVAIRAALAEHDA